MQHPSRTGKTLAAQLNKRRAEASMTNAVQACRDVSSFHCADATFANEPVDQRVNQITIRDGRRGFLHKFHLLEGLLRPV